MENKTEIIPKDSSKIEIEMENKTVIIPKDKWRTGDKLNNFEQSRIISTRSEELAKYGVSTLSNAEKKGISSYQQLAERELALKKIPYKIIRTVGIVNGVKYIEIRDPNEMF